MCRDELKTGPLEQPPRCTIMSFNLLTLTLLAVFFRPPSRILGELPSILSDHHLPHPPQVNAEERPSNIAAPPRCESLPTQHARSPSSSVHDYQQLTARVRQASELCFNTLMSQRKTAPKKPYAVALRRLFCGRSFDGARPAFSGFPASPQHCSRQPATSISLTRDLVKLSKLISKHSVSFALVFSSYRVKHIQYNMKFKARQAMYV